MAKKTTKALSFTTIREASKEIAEEKTVRRVVFSSFSDRAIEDQPTKQTHAKKRRIAALTS